MRKSRCIFCTVIFIILLFILTPIFNGIFSLFKYYCSTARLYWKEIMCTTTITTAIIYLIITLKTTKEIRRLPLIHEKNPESLFPYQFLYFIFKNDDQGKERIATLQQEILVQCTPQKRNNMQKSITSNSILDLQFNYKEHIHRYIYSIDDPDSRQSEIKNIQNKIDLLKNVIHQVKESYSINNGSDTIDFIFNRQNFLTDLFFTGIEIPLIVAVIKSHPSSIKSLIVTVYNNSITCILACMFITILFYRIAKYIQNKFSMINSKQTLAKYNIVTIAVMAFESALNDIINNM